MATLLDQRALPFRSGNSVSKAIESIFDPVIIVSMLLLMSQLSGTEFHKRYLILGFVAFSAHFPGRAFLSLSTYRMVSRTLLEWSLFAGLLLLFLYASDYMDVFNRKALYNWLLFTPFALITCRLTARHYLPRFLAVEGRHRTAVVVGCNPVGHKLAQSFKRMPHHGIRFLGYFDNRSRDRLTHIGNQTLLGSFEQLPQYAREHHVDQIYLSLPMASQPRVLKILDDLKDTTASIYFVPDIFVTDLIQGRVDDIAGMPVVAVCDTPFYGTRGLAKRVLDVSIASFVLLLALPLLAIIAIGVKRSSPGPVIFKQRRYGLDGKEIMVYKFRTMTVTEACETYCEAAQPNDTRVTGFGRMLRRMSLDELPQVFNVLDGSMSIVGPRPHAIAVNEHFRRLIPGYMVRHKVRPGITGWAQVNGYRGGDDLESMTKRIELDLEYLRSWSVGLDLYILARTALLLRGDPKAY